MKVSIKKLHPDAKVPAYATPQAACFDLTAVTYDAESQSYGTGLAFEIPYGHVMLMYSRSGDGFKRGVRLANCTGVIDSDYRGEVRVKMIRDDSTVGYRQTHKIGDRIAQAMIIPYPKVEFEAVESLTDTERGDGGFGSTGA